MPERGRNGLLLCGSLGFYVFGCISCPAAIALLVFLVISNWLLGLGIERRPRLRRAWLVTGIILNIGVLFFFKYVKAISPSALEALGKIGFSTIALPLGLSFYSFRAASYLSDVYHARCYAEENPLRFALWFSFFPVILQGPIVGYTELEKQFSSRQYCIENFASGLRTFVLGLGFKVLIADRLFRLWTKASELNFTDISTPLAWLCIVSYSVYIYFDFAGYSLMAIGVGRMLGFELPENFRQPYVSKSMTEFWRRWHITLGAWFRKYIYIPLGGSRCSKWRNVLNLFAVWLFTGIWHGSHWNFIIWGLGLGVIVVIEKLFLKKYLDKSRVLCHIYMALLIPLSWAVFAVSDMSVLANLFSRLFPFFSSEGIWFAEGDWISYLSTYWPYLTAGLVFCTGIPEFLHKKYEKTVVWNILLLAVFIVSVWFIFKTGADPFAYGNF